MDFKTKLKEYIEAGNNLELGFQIPDSKDFVHGILKDVQDDFIEIFIGGNPQQIIKAYIPIKKIISIKVTQPR